MKHVLQLRVKNWTVDSQTKRNIGYPTLNQHQRAITRKQIKGWSDERRKPLCLGEREMPDTEKLMYVCTFVA